MVTENSSNHPSIQERHPRSLAYLKDIRSNITASMLERGIANDIQTELSAAALYGKKNIANITSNKNTRIKK